MRTECGTSLIELLVVLSILTLVSAVGVTAFDTLKARQLDRESAVAAMWLRSVRRDAMLTGTDPVIVMVGTQLRAQTRGASSRPKISGDVTMSIISSTHGGTSLCFFPDGSACPGILEIANHSGKRRLSIGWLGEIDVQ